ncbi:hypothetical protein P7K49_016720 [Saguinus oedipus]|uniref:Uncharacterized protein n=1 Tax=Saguinus oedipus TaxID=9490 RepID=A0ABQ9VD65_SAGOE|nr:hypothetical protein P7K49_016720 [Saguinus oedipus]
MCCVASPPRLPCFQSQSNRQGLGEKRLQRPAPALPQRSPCPRPRSSRLPGPGTRPARPPRAARPPRRPSLRVTGPSRPRPHSPCAAWRADRGLQSRRVAFHGRCEENSFRLFWPPFSVAPIGAPRPPPPPSPEPSATARRRRRASARCRAAAGRRAPGAELEAGAPRPAHSAAPGGRGMRDATLSEEFSSPTDQKISSGGAPRVASATSVAGAAVLARQLFVHSKRDWFPY